jgi:hypothetical protein
MKFTFRRYSLILLFLFFLVDHSSAQNDLVRWYQFNGNTADSSQTKDHLVPFKTKDTTDRFGNRNSAVHLSNGAFLSGDTTLLPTGKESRSISLWLKLDVNPDSDIPIIWGNTNLGGGYGIALGNDLDFKGYRAMRHIGWGIAYDHGFKIQYPVNRWFYLATTYDGDTAKTYLNGVLIAAANRSNWNTNSGFFLIGKNMNNRRNDYFQGSLDDIKIFSTALSSGQIDSIYKSERANTDIYLNRISSSKSLLCRNDSVQIGISVYNEGASTIDTAVVRLQIEASDTIILDDVTFSIMPGHDTMVFFEKWIPKVGGRHNLNFRLYKKKTTLILRDSFVQEGIYYSKFVDLPDLEDKIGCRNSSVILNTNLKNSEVRWYDAIDSNKVAAVAPAYMIQGLTSQQRLFYEKNDTFQTTIGKAALDTVGDDAYTRPYSGGRDAAFGLHFTARKEFTLDSATAFIEGKGEVRVVLWDSLGNVYKETPSISVNGKSLTDPITIPVNFKVVPGRYVIGLLVYWSSGQMKIGRDRDFNQYPLYYENGDVSIDQGSVRNRYYWLYNWKLTFRDCYSDTHSVRINPAQQPFELPSDTQYCSNIPFQLKIELPSDSVEYIWNNKDSTSTINIDSSGIYKVEANDQNGCKHLDSIRVDELSQPFFEVENELSFCPTDKIFAEFDLDSFQSVLWNGQSVVGKYSIQDTGEYIVQVFAENGCFNSKSINVKRLPVVSAQLPDNKRICKNIEWSDTLSIPDWFNDIVWGPSFDTTKIVVVENYGRITVQAVDSNKCVMRDTVWYFPVPVAPFRLPGDTSICKNEWNDFALVAEGDWKQFKWNNGDTTATVLVSQPTQYKVVVSDSNHCNREDSIMVTELSIPQFSLGSDTILTSNKQFPLTLESDYMGAGDYSWSTGSTAERINANDTGLYWLEIIDQNGCSNRDSISVSLEHTTSVFLSRIEDLAVFPNPARDYVQVDTKVMVQYVVYTLTGTIYEVGTISPEAGRLDCSKWENGLYHIQFKKDNRFQVFKLVIQH